MRFVFDIDENNYVSASIVPLGDNMIATNISRAVIEHPIRDTMRLRDELAYSHLSNSQFQTILDRVFSLEPLFSQSTTVKEFLEQLVEAFINREVST